MMSIKLRATSAAAIMVGLGLTATALTAPVEAHTTGIHDNCTNFNRKYPHGVGKRGARDRGGDVSNFLRNNKIYNTAERHNSDLDRDNDGIACEKA
jgi:hypothetical protein